MQLPFDFSAKSRARWGLGLTLLVVFGLGLAIGARGLSFAAAPTPLGPTDADLAPFYTAWTLLQEHYASASTTAPATSDQKKIYGAIEGLAASYGDPYTTFFPPIEKQKFDTQVQGDFQGVGMEIAVKNDVLTVIAPLKGTPAERAGIEAGDQILAIDNASTAGLSADEAVQQIRGPKGSSVTLTLSRKDKAGGKPFDVMVTRDTILLPTLDTTARPDGVFVIQLYSFDAKATQLFRDAVRQFAESGDSKLIIDLRGNPGGYLEAATDIASWFLPAGKPVVIEAYADSSKNSTLRSYGYNVFTDQLTLVILIDKGSASSAEILAGALHDYGIATLIGMQSFGKGSVQQVFPVTDDTSIKITIARWLTPKGTSISSVGLTPDIKVNKTDADTAAGRDPQLDRAVQYLTTGK